LALDLSLNELCCGLLRFDGGLRDLVIIREERILWRAFERHGLLLLEILDEFCERMLLV